MTEKIFLYIIAAVLALFMVTVFILFLKELKAHNSLTAEYEAAKEATELTERYTSGETITRDDLSPRVKSFGVYLYSGEAALVLGKAPESLDFLEVQHGMILPEGKSSILRLIRPIGGMRMPMSVLPGQRAGQRPGMRPSQGLHQKLSLIQGFR